MPDTLPPGQGRIVEAFIALQQFYGFSPSIPRVSKALKIRNNGVIQQVHRLEHKGFMKRAPIGNHCTWTVTPKGHEWFEGGAVVTPVLIR